MGRMDQDLPRLEFRLLPAYKILWPEASPSPPATDLAFIEDPNIEECENILAYIL